MRRKRAPRKYVVCRIDELPPGEHRIFRTPDRREIGVYNVNGEFFAIRNVCPHHGGPLCLGVTAGTSVARFNAAGPPEIVWERTGEIVRCPWHGWEFDLRSGRAISGPELRTATYRVSIEQGQVETAETAERGPGPVERFPVSVDAGVVMVEVS